MTILILWSGFWAAPQDGAADKIGSKKASTILSKSAGATLKEERCRFRQKVRVKGAQERGADFTGQLRPKRLFAAAKGTAEIYAKGGRYLVASGGTYVPPEKLSGDAAAQAASFRNPILFFAEARRLAATARWGADAKAGTIECKVAEFSADTHTRKEQVKEFSRNMGELKRYGLGDISGYVDLKRSSSTYKVFVGKKDLLIHRLEWTLRPVVKKNALPPNLPITIPENLEANVEIDLDGYGEKLTLDLPAAIRRWAGVKE